jgi:type IV pilus assembly protein PilA
MQDTLRKLRAKRADGDRGFTLIELLVVVVIIDVLIAIAIPLYLNYKKGAENKSAESDVRNAVTAIEQCYTENSNAYPASASGAAGVTVSLSCGTGNTEKVNASTGNAIAYVNVGGNPATYTVAVTNSDTNKTFTYDSSTGKIS